MNAIASKIKEIIESQGLVYMRSVNINDLNQQVGEIDVSQGVGVYANIAEVSAQRFNNAPQVILDYSVEVYYLKPNTTTDETGEQVDEILDALFDLANRFVDQMNSITPSGFSIESYQIDGVETLKLTKEVLTGWRVRFDLPVFRKDVCQT